nr:reverse transcriptase domain-containing protein [Tanacetum cinerariifolium]
MSDFDIILGMDWLTEHRATIECHTKCVIFGDLNNPEFITMVPDLNSFDCPPDPYHPPHPTYKTYSGDTCGNDSKFGYDFPPHAHHDLLGSQTKLNFTLTKVNEQMTQLTSMCELACQLVQKNLEDKQLEEEQAVKAQCWKLPICYDDDDDEESSNPLEDNIISELPSYSAVTPTEPIDSLSMGDEHLYTIPATESDEFIKSCVENLVPNPSESEGENKCDMPAGFTTFYNVLFDDDYDSDSSDDQSLSDEDVREKIYSNPLFDEEIIPMEIDQHSFNVESDLIESMPNHDSSITISLKIDSFFDEFVGELTLLKSIPPGIDKTDCHPENEIRLTKRLLYDNSSPRPPEEIVLTILMLILNLSLHLLSPIRIKMMMTLQRDISIFEELLDNYSLSLPDNESYHFDIPSPYRPPTKPPDGNTGTLNIQIMGDVSDQKVPKPNFTITRVLNQEKSPDLLSH